MSEYHAYVFDNDARHFVGRFDEMYRDERQKGFDSWHQDDLRPLDRKICISILNQFNFSKILDVGCGKGAFTQFLKKHNNHVSALDISPTAIKRAKARYPDIDFIQADISNPAAFQNVGGVDLIVCMELLSYIQNWQLLLNSFAQMGRHTLIKLFIPENPIGYVKSIDDLCDEFSRNFEILEDIRIVQSKKYILFGRSRVMLE